LFQKFGIDQVTDELLEQELTVRVNVGMGATDPSARLQKFMFALQGYQHIAQANVAAKTGLNMQSVFAEIMAISGYQDGTRFAQQDDPEKSQLQAQILAMQQQMKQMGMAMRDKSESIASKERIAAQGNQVKLAIAGKKSDTDVAVQSLKEHHSGRRTLAELAAPILLGQQQQPMGVPPMRPPPQQAQQQQPQQSMGALANAA
jgi:hypothetical protein